MLLDVDLQDGAAEARLLHPSKHGFVALMRRTAAGGLSQRMYPAALVEDLVRGMRSTPDAYLSQAAFVAPRRRVSSLMEIRTAFVDIDCYTLGITPDEAFVARIVNQARAIGLPEPTYIVGSGRGLYAKWVFETPVAAQHLPRWQMLQSALTQLYKSLGCDLKVRDAARVLRLLGSTNSKALKSEESVRLRKVGGELHNFDDMCVQVEVARLVGHMGGVSDARWDLPNLEDAGEAANETEAAIRRISAAARKGKQLLPSTTDLKLLERFEAERQPVMLKAGTVQSLNWARFVDLRNLAMQRGGIHRGSRDLFMLWMMNCLAHADVVTPRNFWSEATSLSQVISAEDFNPVEDGSFTTLFSRVQAKCAGQKVAYNGGNNWSPLYTPSNEHLIEALEITESEQQTLCTLISSREKQRRRDAQAPGRAERRVERITFRAEATELLTSGVDVKAVAATLGASEQKVRRLRQAAGLNSTAQEAPEWHQRARELAGNGVSHAEIGRMLNVNRSSVKRLMDRPVVQLPQVKAGPAPGQTSDDIRQVSDGAAEIESCVSTSINIEERETASHEAELLVATAAARRALDEAERERNEQALQAERHQAALAAVNKVEQLRLAALRRAERQAHSECSSETPSVVDGIQTGQPSSAAALKASQLAARFAGAHSPAKSRAQNQPSEVSIKTPLPAATEEPDGQDPQQAEQGAGIAGPCTGRSGCLGPRRSIRPATAPNSHADGRPGWWPYNDKFGLSAELRWRAASPFRDLAERSKRLRSIGQAKSSSDTGGGGPSAVDG
jgi:hypothetical protein